MQGSPQDFVEAWETRPYAHVYFSIRVIYTLHAYFACICVCTACALLVLVQCAYACTCAI